MCVDNHLMYVGFLYVEKLRCPSSFFLMRSLLKGKLLFVSVSIGNWIMLLILLMCDKKAVSVFSMSANYKAVVHVSDPQGVF